jgi:hypothetical protein
MITPHAGISSAATVSKYNNADRHSVGRQAGKVGNRRREADGRRCTGTAGEVNMAEGPAVTFCNR